MSKSLNDTIKSGFSSNNFFPVYLIVYSILLNKYSVIYIVLMYM